MSRFLGDRGRGRTITLLLYIDLYLKKFDEQISEIGHVVDVLILLRTYDALVVTKFVEGGVGWERLYT